MGIVFTNTSLTKTHLQFEDHFKSQMINTNYTDPVLLEGHERWY